MKETHFLLIVWMLVVLVFKSIIETLNRRI